jgi:hypothetical protein
LLIEIKDTTRGRRLVYQDRQFKGYLIQLLYNMIVAQREHGILVIHYSVKEQVWRRPDSEGVWFVRPPDAKAVGIESWNVYMSMMIN